MGFILLLFLEALFDLLCSSPSHFPSPLPSWRVFLMFFNPLGSRGEPELVPGLTRLIANTKESVFITYFAQ